MLKRAINYEDFEGNPAVDVFYFNISEPELIELEVEFDKGFKKMLESIIEAKDHKNLIKRFKEIVLMAYGQKSEDGKRFIKSDQLREEFSQTAAFNTLFIEFATDDKKAATFLKSVLPKDMIGEIDKALADNPPTTTTPTPVI